MINELLQAFFLIFIAEMGDKSQIIAMVFASKYKVRNVIIGLSIGIFFNHALAILIGSNLGSFIPLEMLSIISGFLFIVFGLMSLKVSDDESVNVFSKFGPILTVAIAFFLGELGDKTQFAAIALSSDATYPLIILIGTVSGMIFTSLIGIFIGIKFGSKIPIYYIKVISSFVFILFGLLKLYSSLPKEYIEPIYYIPLLLAIIVVSIILFKPLYTNHQNEVLDAYQIAAENLKNYYSDISNRLEAICLGTENCGTCEGNDCLLGYTKNIVKKAVKGENVDLSYYRGSSKKSFNDSKVVESLSLTLSILKNNWNKSDYEYIQEIRKNLELIVFKEAIEAKSFREYFKYIKSNHPEQIKRISKFELHPKTWT